MSCLALPGESLLSIETIKILFSYREKERGQDKAGAGAGQAKAEQGKPSQGLLLYREGGASLLLYREEKVSPLYIERRETPPLYKGKSVSLLYREEADPFSI